MKKIIFIFFVIISQNVFAQIKIRTPLVLIDKGINRVLQSDTLHWYGLDWALLKISDPKKITEGEKLKSTFCPAWSAWFNKQYPQSRIAGTLHTLKLEDNRYPFEVENYKEIDANSFVIHLPYKVNLDTIVSRVKKYSFAEKSGIGVSIIMENFNKIDEACIANIAFFDLENKEILWLTKISGKPGAKGMTAFWGEGLYEVWSYFIAKEFDIKRKNLRK